jgi:hypothetical protein
MSDDGYSTPKTILTGHQVANISVGFSRRGVGWDEETEDTSQTRDWRETTC